MDKALQTQRGELTNNLAKLSRLDKDIAKEKRKLTETNEPLCLNRGIFCRFCQWGDTWNWVNFFNFIKSVCVPGLLLPYY